jgi:glutamate-5-semialdehyde dehydrogenase
MAEAKEIISNAAKAARKAARTLSHSSYQARQGALIEISKEISARAEEIIAANQKDITAAIAEGIAPAMQDRLLLTAERVNAIAEAAKALSKLPDPLNEVLRERTLNNGLHLQQVTVPFGVVGMVYEARPNVTVDAALILLMSGNAALLRGSASAKNSNQILVSIMRDALKRTEIDPEVLQLIPSDDRATVIALLKAKGEVDLVIPRGSANLIQMVVDEALVPTIETGAGVCHVYVDEYADLSKAMPIVINSKTHRPSVCNAAETLLVHQSLSETFLPAVIKQLDAAGVKLHGDEKSMAVGSKLEIAILPAADQDYKTEYNALEMNIRVVPDLLTAIDHIEKYGTRHTEAIVTESETRAEEFIKFSDCAAVMVNASTRFTDGEQMGFGAEIGISNQKLHARGPMGLEQMTTTTWIVRGNGQIRN